MYSKTVSLSYQGTVLCIVNILFLYSDPVNGPKIEYSIIDCKPFDKVDEHLKLGNGSTLYSFWLRASPSCSGSQNIFAKNPHRKITSKNNSTVNLGASWVVNRESDSISPTVVCFFWITFFLCEFFIENFCYRSLSRIQ